MDFLLFGRPAFDTGGSQIPRPKSSESKSAHVGADFHFHYESGGRALSRAELSFNINFSQSCEEHLKTLTKWSPAAYAGDVPGVRPA